MKKVLLFIVVSIHFVSCRTDNSNLSPDTDHYLENDTSLSAKCPRFTFDHKGNVVLSFVKEINDSIAYFCYAVSEDNGKSFKNTVEIKESFNVHPHGENLPKLIFKPNGAVIAMWGVSHPSPESKYSGLVYYTHSEDNGNSWAPPVQLVKDTSAYDQRYFDMALLPNGEVMAVWLDNRGKKEEDGSTLFCAITNGDQVFTNEKKIAETCCPCCRTDLYVDAERFVHVVFRDIINDSIRDMAHLVSGDNGKSFSEPVRISADNWVINGCPHTGPTMAESKSILHFAWYSLGGEGGLFYCKSGDNGRTYSRRHTVSASHAAKHPQIIAMPEGNVLIVWDEYEKDDKGGSNFIMIQLRSPGGDVIDTRRVTKSGEKNEFPAVLALDENSAILAYTHRLEETSAVVWKHLDLNSSKK